MSGRDEALRWLEPRVAAAPAELAARVRAALRETTADTVPGALAEAALSCLRRATGLGGDRAAALDLLAADALLTHACEAAAEQGSAALAALTARFGPAGLDSAGTTVSR